MLWRNLSSIRGQTHKKTDVNLFFYNNKTLKWSNVGNKYEGKRSCKQRLVSLIENDANIVNSFSRFFDWLLKKCIKFHWLKSWQFDSWKLNLQACIKSYPCIFLLIMKMNQSVREKLDIYCKIDNRILKRCHCVVFSVTWESFCFMLKLWRAAHFLWTMKNSLWNLHLAKWPILVMEQSVGSNALQDTSW